MRDALEDQLATRLRALGDTVHDELVLPVDLELSVARRRRRTRATRTWSVMTVAVAVIVAATTVVVVHGTAGGHGAPRIETSPSSTAMPVHDALPAGTVLLDARGRYVIALDATGHTNATMVTAEHGPITYANATADHRALWYLSLKNGLNACGDVVREDGADHSTKIVTRAVAFDVSPDGSRLALYGAGDLAHGACAPVGPDAPGRVVVLDLTSAASSAVTLPDVTSLRWAPDGSYVVAAVCAPAGCDGIRRIAVPARLGPPLQSVPVSFGAPAGRPVRSASVAFGPGAVYVLISAPGAVGSAVTETETVDRYNPQTLTPSGRIFAGGAGWTVSQVVATTAGVYVVATRVVPKGHPAAAPGLYRVAAGRLIPIRTLLADPGTLSAVAPLAAA